MSIRPIRYFGDPVLTTRAEPVRRFDAALSRLASDMVDTMRAARGVGLAAPQIGVSRRIFVFDTRRAPAGLSGVLVNPVIRPLGEEVTQGVEGCLSLPGLHGKVTRPARVIATGQDLTGRPMSLVASGLLARCLQHEADHLDGVLYLDHLAVSERRALMAEIRGAEWFGASR